MDTSLSLRSFLDGPGAPPDALGYNELQGFLFTVVSAPEMILPSEWLPLALGDESEAKFESEEQARAMLDQLMTLYNEINASVLDGTVGLPAGCTIAEDVMANFDEDGAIAQWSRGFLYGHQWLSELWDEVVPEELADDVAATTVMLCFFSSRELAEDCTREAARAGQTLEDMADTVRRVIPEAMREYAAIGRALGEALAEAEREAEGNGEHEHEE